MDNLGDLSRNDMDQQRQQQEPLPSATSIVYTMTTATPITSEIISDLEPDPKFEITPLERLEEPIIEEPVPEEPIIEEPVPEEPIIEEPVPEEPIIEEPVLEQSSVEEPVREEPIIEEPVPEEPIIEEPVPEEPIIEEPVPEQSSVEEPIPQEPVIEGPVPDEPIIEESALEEPIIEEPVHGKPSIEEPVIEEPVAREAAPEELVVEQLIAENPVLDKPTNGKHEVEQLASDEPVSTGQAIQDSTKKEQAIDKPVNEELVDKIQVNDQTVNEAPQVVEPIIEEPKDAVQEPVEGAPEPAGQTSRPAAKSPQKPKVKQEINTRRELRDRLSKVLRSRESIKRGPEEEPVQAETPKIEPPKKQVKKTRGSGGKSTTSYEAAKNTPLIKLPNYRSRQTISSSDPITRLDKRYESPAQVSAQVETDKKFICHQCGFSTNRLNNLVYHSTKSFCKGKLEMGEIMKADIIRKQQEKKPSRKSMR